MFGHYIRNNVGIAFQCFAGGLFFGIGSLFVLAFNGVMAGSVAGYLTWRGYGENFYSFVVTHGAFELTAIVLAGAAGLVLGRALLAPGRRTPRRRARARRRRAIVLVYGIAAMLFVAAALEAFWSSARWVEPSGEVRRRRRLLGSRCIAYFVFQGRPRRRAAAADEGRRDRPRPAPRGMFEAADLGVRIVAAQRALGLGSCLPVYASSVLVAGSALPFGIGWAFLALIWLKPWLDRSLLFVLARAAFRRATRFADLLPRGARSGAGPAGAFTMRRLSPWRSYVQPVAAARGPARQGAARARSRRILGTIAARRSAMQSAFATVESALTLGLAVLLMPGSCRSTIAATGWRSSTPAGLWLAALQLALLRGGGGHRRAVLRRRRLRDVPEPARRARSLGHRAGVSPCLRALSIGARAAARGLGRGARGGLLRGDASAAAASPEQPRGQRRRSRRAWRPPPRPCAPTPTWAACRSSAPGASSDATSPSGRPRSRALAERLSRAGSPRAGASWSGWSSPPRWSRSLVGARRWLAVRGDALGAAGVRLPSHVRELDIRPESLPADIGAAVRELVARRRAPRRALAALPRRAVAPRPFATRCRSTTPAPKATACASHAPRCRRRAATSSPGSCSPGSSRSTAIGRSRPSGAALCDDFDRLLPEPRRLAAPAAPSRRRAMTRRGGCSLRSSRCSSPASPPGSCRRSNGSTSTCRPSPRTRPRATASTSPSSSCAGSAPTVVAAHSLEQLPPPGATLVLGSPHWNMFPGRDAALRRWVDAGGHLVVVAERVVGKRAKCPLGADAQRAAAAASGRRIRRRAVIGRRRFAEDAEDEAHAARHRRTSPRSCAACGRDRANVRRFHRARRQRGAFGAPRELSRLRLRRAAPARRRAALARSSARRRSRGARRARPRRRHRQRARGAFGTATSSATTAPSPSPRCCSCTPATWSGSSTTKRATASWRVLWANGAPALLLGARGAGARALARRARFGPLVADAAARAPLDRRAGPAHRRLHRRRRRRGAAPRQPCARSRRSAPLDRRLRRAARRGRAQRGDRARARRRRRRPRRGDAAAAARRAARWPRRSPRSSAPPRPAASIAARRGAPPSLPSDASPP